MSILPVGPAPLSMAAVLALVLGGTGFTSAPPAALASPASVADGPAGPAVRCAPETLDMGELTVGQPKTVPFTVRNAGPEPMTVESVKGGCGCTTVSAPPKGPIAPGESFTVQVTVDPGKKGGVDLVKPLYVAYAGGRVESVQIKGRVKAVALVTPTVIESTDAESATRRISIESASGERFRVTGIAPAGILAAHPADAVAARVDLAFDRAAWERSGRPSSVAVSTDLPGAPEVVVPIRSAQAVSMFRLPPASGDAAARRQAESEQSAIVRSIDAGLGAGERSSQFGMRLHRESGMLFVHGTDADLDAVRDAVRALPASMSVRESRPTPGT